MAVEAEWPNAVQILDFYYAMEHIWKYVKVAVKKKSEMDKDKEASWNIETKRYWYSKQTTRKNTKAHHNTKIRI